LVGEAKVINNDGERILNNGDELILGDLVQSLDANSSLDLELTNGKIIHLAGKEVVKLDSSVLNDENLSDVSEIDDKINAVLSNILANNEIPQELDATAAGDNAVLGAGASLSQSEFLQSGSESKVSADVNSINAQNIATTNAANSVNTIAINTTNAVNNVANEGNINNDNANNANEDNTNNGTTDNGNQDNNEGNAGNEGNTDNGNTENGGNTNNGNTENGGNADNGNTENSGNTDNGSDTDNGSNTENGSENNGNNTENGGNTENGNNENGDNTNNGGNNNDNTEKPAANIDLIKKDGSVATSEEILKDTEYTVKIENLEANKTYIVEIYDISNDSNTTTTRTIEITTDENGVGYKTIGKENILNIDNLDNGTISFTVKDKATNETIIEKTYNIDTVAPEIQIENCELNNTQPATVNADLNIKNADKVYLVKEDGTKIELISSATENKTYNVSFEYSENAKIIAVDKAGNESSVSVDEYLNANNQVEESPEYSFIIVDNVTGEKVVSEKATNHLDYSVKVIGAKANEKLTIDIAYIDENNQIKSVKVENVVANEKGEANLNIDFSKIQAGKFEAGHFEGNNFVVKVSGETSGSANEFEHDLQQTITIDNIFNMNLVKFESNADSSTKFDFYFDEKTTANIIDKDGNVTQMVFEKGTHTIEIADINNAHIDFFDKAGNEKSYSLANEVNNYFGIYDENGNLANGSLNAQNYTFKGKAYPNETYKIHLNAQDTTTGKWTEFTKEVKADAKGYYELTIDFKKDFPGFDGDKANIKIDFTGNDLASELHKSFGIDTTAPQIKIDSYESNEDNSFNLIVDIKGKAEKVVAILPSGKEVELTYQIIDTKNGQAEKYVANNISPFEEGIKIIATDKVGNKSEISLDDFIASQNPSEDVTPPHHEEIHDGIYASKITDYNTGKEIHDTTNSNNITIVGGGAKAGSTISIVIKYPNGGEDVTYTWPQSLFKADKDGNFKLDIKISPEQGNYKIYLFDGKITTGEGLTSLKPQVSFTYDKNYTESNTQEQPNNPDDIVDTKPENKPEDTPSNDAQTADFNHIKIDSITYVNGEALSNENNSMVWQIHASGATPNHAVAMKIIAPNGKEVYWGYGGVIPPIVADKDGNFTYNLKLYDVNNPVLSGEYKISFVDIHTNTNYVDDFNDSITFTENFVSNNAQADTEYAINNDSHSTKIDEIINNNDGTYTIKGHGANKDGLTYVSINGESLIDTAKNKHYFDADNNGNFSYTVKLNPGDTIVLLNPDETLNFNTQARIPGDASVDNSHTAINSYVYDIVSFSANNQILGKETNSTFIEVNCKSNGVNGFATLWVKYPNGDIYSLNSTGEINSDGSFKFYVDFATLYGTNENHSTIKDGKYEFAAVKNGYVPSDADFKGTIIFNEHYEASNTNADSNGFYNDGHIVKLDKIENISEDAVYKTIKLAGHGGRDGEFVWVMIEHPNGHKDYIPDMSAHKQYTEARADGSWDITLKLPKDGTYKFYLFNNDQAMSHETNDYHASIDLKPVLGNEFNNDAQYGVKLDEMINNNGEIILKGHGAKAYDNVYIQIKHPDGKLDSIDDILHNKHYVESNQDGSWQTTIKLSTDGKYEFYLYNSNEELSHKTSHASTEVTGVSTVISEIDVIQYTDGSTSQEHAQDNSKQIDVIQYTDGTHNKEGISLNKVANISLASEESKPSLDKDDLLDSAKDLFGAKIAPASSHSDDSVSLANFDTNKELHNLNDELGKHNHF
ncbi:hypothetical protein AVCANL279_08750, partial [Campylobacter canadensis]|uniref:hypothetical protein n=1 Tax=Campylobacter canadensis TaxID=449520 RepID=UPI001CCA2408